METSKALPYTRPKIWKKLQLQISLHWKDLMYFQLKKVGRKKLEKKMLSCYTKPNLGVGEPINIQIHSTAMRQDFK